MLSLQSLSKRPSSFCLIHFRGISGASRGHLGGSSGAAQGWKPTFDGRRPLMEDDFRWKTIYDGRRQCVCCKLDFDFETFPYYYGQVGSFYKLLGTHRRVRSVVGMLVLPNSTPQCTMGQFRGSCTANFKNLFL